MLHKEIMNEYRKKSMARPEARKCLDAFAAGYVDVKNSELAEAMKVLGQSAKVLRLRSISNSRVFLEVRTLGEHIKNQ